METLGTHQLLSTKNSESAVHHHTVAAAMPFGAADARLHYHLQLGTGRVLIVIGIVPAV